MFLNSSTQLFTELRVVVVHKFIDFFFLRLRKICIAIFFYFFFLVAYLSPSNFGISEQLDESSSHASVGLLESTPELCSPDNISCCTIAGSYALISNFKWT